METESAEKKKRREEILGEWRPARQSESRKTKEVLTLLWTTKKNKKKEGIHLKGKLKKPTTEI